MGTVLGLLTIFPLLWMVSGAFKPEDEIWNMSLLPSSPTLDNFIYVFTEVPFLRYMFNSFFVSAVVTVAALLFHSMAAYALARLKFRGRETIFMVIFSTLLVSLPVVLIPTFVVVRTLGLLDSYAGLIIPMIFNAFGIFLLRQFYLGLPDELEEAAMIDGAGYWRIFWNVVLPLSKPILSALAVFFFLANWNSFIWPLTITANPDLRVVQVGIATFQQQYAANWNYVLAAATVAAAPTLLMFFFFQKQIVASIKTSGIK
ncbi:carbohydrate ABC transporter permease [Arthrobacter castelli]|uniref:carbohydrate ABC transporter permease n=1 Tax=Arthrobacter castelli TaxID=271431 RepID=UPI001FE2387A|nr:carbohydrate ABC transporter permease [Arthrobacter castelli]